MTHLWMQKIEAGLEEIGAMPLWGTPPPFLWKTFAEELGKALGSENIVLSCHMTKWVKTHNLLASMGPENVLISFSGTPLEGHCYWMMSATDASSLTTALLSTEKKGLGFSDHKFQEGFITYIVLEALHLLQKLKSFGNLSFSVAQSILSPEEEALCSDVQIEIGEKTIWGKLICPQQFHSAFTTHFATEKPSLASSPLLKELDVPLSLQIGSVSLSQKQWGKVSIGDCIFLDRCSLDLTNHKGNATVVLGNTPLLRVRIKSDHLKILDYAFYQEEVPMMKPDEEGNELDNDGTQYPSGEEPSGDSDAHLWSTAAAEGVTEEQRLIPTDQIPVVLTVEIGRIKMNLEQLLQLAPGNLLELPIRPETAVHLTIDGKMVAKAEMVKIGDALGVKILKLGR